MHSAGIDRARDAFDRRAWRRAYDELSAVNRHETLEVDDLERLASAAYLVGLSAESCEAWARAHQECANIGEITRAARCAFWLAFALLNNGELARGGGWVDRAQRLLDGRNIECVEQGYLRYAAALRSAFSGDVEVAYEGFHWAGEAGALFRDAELVTLARIGEGRCLIYLGRIDEGVALLDEAMVAIEANELSAIAVGDAYCTVIEGCQELFDVRRAQEWTAALTKWCDAQPELVLYHGQCLIHRAEIQQLRGEWADALDHVDRACHRLADPPGQLALGAAFYVRGDLHRLKGEYAAAEDAYRSASELGRDPQPGLALLRFATGRLDIAAAAIRRAYQEANESLVRARLVGSYVEIVLAAGDVAAARAAAEELAALATKLDQPVFRALNAHVTGAVQLSEDQHEHALSSLRGAWTAWRELGAPYEAARERVLIGLACRALGDDDGAEMELDAACSTFAQLGAVPDLDHARSLSRLQAAKPTSGLTPREQEVLTLVATGRTNRQIAEQLVISEKTVASHVSHIFTKLALSSRAAATAYAYEHGLV